MRQQNYAQEALQVLRKKRTWILMQGDCLEVMSQIPPHSIDMILCDLPYGTTNCSWDVVIPLDPLWREYRRLVKPRGAVVLTACQPFTSLLVASNLKGFRCEWIWEKEQGSNFMTAKYHPMRVHENIVVFAWGGAVRYYPVWGWGEPYGGLPEKRERKKVIETISSRGCGTYEMRYGSPDGRRYPRSVVRFNRERGLHPTQKPVTLFEYMIATYSRPGDVILDNCAGSGTTGVATLRLGRRCIMIEREEKYCEIIRRRMAQAEQMLAEEPGVY